MASSASHDVMISYNCKYKDIILEIADHLKNEGISCWLDEDNMLGQRCLLGAMGDAVDNCKMFLMCYSTEYDLSPNCRLEASYAIKREKIIIPCKMESGFEPKGWLGIVLGAKLYIDFSERSSFKQKLQQLTEEIKVHLHVRAVEPYRPKDDDFFELGLNKRSETKVLALEWTPASLRLAYATQNRQNRTFIKEFEEMFEEIEKMLSDSD